jgi:sulfur-oxidizing protein SoxY
MSTDTKRRLFLKGSVAASALGVAVGAGLLTPQAVLAAWPEAAFTAKEVGAAAKELLGTDATTESADINVKAPDIAENGAVVPITVETSIEGVESIAIMASENPVPLVANFVMGEGALGFSGTRIKMGKTGDVVALVKAGDTVYTARKNVKVTIGGCGG